MTKPATVAKTDTGAAGGSRLPRRSLLPADDRVERKRIARAFGKNLRRQRSQAGLSQSELAARSCLRHDTISQLERGVAKPTIFVLLTLADALGVAVADLLADLPVPRREKSAKAMIAAAKRRQGITSQDLAREMNVHGSYVHMLGVRLLAEGRLQRRGQEWWPPDADGRAARHLTRQGRAAGTGTSG
jgi:ribosome-binding protein aMBF1 (putative translation factor)